MKYYIRAIYSGWKEVNKEKYEAFRKSILDGAVNVDKNNPERLKEFLSKHSKVVD